MKTTILEANGKPAFAIVPWDEYQALRALAEDAGDAAALLRHVKKSARRGEDTIPAEVIDRLLADEPPLRVWREHRGLSATRLAKSVGVTVAHISKIESGKGEPSLPLLRKLARALQIDSGLLVGRD
jgi:ribosome-binding protein aMBF1 (putative translation factor)